MTQKRRFKKLTAGILTVFLILFAAAATFAYVKGIFPALPLPRTDRGFLLEEFVPPDLSTIVSFSPSDNAERQRFAAVLEKILGDKKDALLPLVAGEIFDIKQDVKSLSDLQSIFAEDFRVLVAFDELNRISRKVNFYLFAAAKNPELTRRYFLANVAQANAAKSGRLIENEKDTFLAEKDRYYFGIAGDVIFVTNAGEKKAGEILKNYKKNFLLKLFASSISKLPDLRRAVSRFEKPFSGYVFSELRGKNYPLNVMPFAAGTFRAHADGIVLNSFSPIDKNEKTAKKSNFAPFLSPFPLSLHKKVPVARPMLFFATHHLGNILMIEAALLEETLGITVKNIYDGFRQFAGFDFQNDILPFLNKDFVFALQDGGDILPTASLFIDASGAPEKAFGVVAKLDSVVPMWLALANMSLKAGTETPVFEKTNFSGIPMGGVVKIYLDRGDVPGIPLFKRMQKPLEISYGITPQNILFVSTAADLEKAMLENKTIEESPLWPAISAKSANASSIFVVEADAIFSSLRRFADFAKQADKLSAKEEDAFEVLGNYLKNVEGAVGANEFSDDELKSYNLLKIR